jgi:hypothetical protein
MNPQLFQADSPLAGTGHQVTPCGKLGWMIMFAVFFLPVFAGSLPAADKAGWTSDHDKAKTNARDSAKDLVIVFTGRGWCYQCDLLDREVFQQAAFVKAAGKDYILVELDFTFGDPKADKDRQVRYRKFQEKYLVQESGCNRQHLLTWPADAAGISAFRGTSFFQRRRR